MQLTPEQFLRLEAVKMQGQVCAGGKCTFIVSPSGAAPVLDTRR